jgi:hypothetical protein
MDGSGGVPPTVNTAPSGLDAPNTPPIPAPANTNIISALRFLTIDPLFSPPPATPPLLLRNVLNVQPLHQNDDALLNLLFTTHYTSTLMPPTTQPVADVSSNPAPAPAPAPAPPTDASNNSVEQPTSDVSSNTPVTPPIVPWSERSLTPPPKGTVRLLSPPPAEAAVCDALAALWDTDHTFTQWAELIATNEQARDVFYANQRERWYAWMVWYRLTQRIWRRRTQCNVDMIEMAPIADADAILITDTTHRMIYRFHRHDLFNTLLSNICMSDEMLPNPREPRNPWTNAPFTYGQIVGVCQALLQDYARRGRCPPVLFSAFWAARFDVRRFAAENASLLSQHAINAYFKDVTDHNRDTVADTIQTLLAEAGVSLVPVHVRRWLRVTPLTEAHRAWLAFARDYTLYMNLHVQVRPHWHSEEMVYRDVRRLHQRHPITDNAGPRLRVLRNMGATPGPGMLDLPSNTEPAIQNLLTLLMGPSTGSGLLDDAFGNIQHSLFGGRGSGGR